MKHYVKICWEGSFTTTHEFATVEQLNAFMEGVEAALGASSYRVLKDSREAASRDDRIPPLDRPNLVTIHDLPLGELPRIETFRSGIALQWRYIKRDPHVSG